MNRPNKYWNFIVDFFFFFSLFLRKIANTKQWHVYFWCYETVFVDSMAISLIFTIEKSFLSYLIKNILLAFWLNRGGKVKTSSLELKIFAILIVRNVHARVGVFLFVLNRHQQCGKNAVKITYYLHTNIFQLFSCQVSISFDRLAAFRELCDIAFNIYFYIYPTK